MYIYIYIYTLLQMHHVTYFRVIQSLPMFSRLELIKIPY